MTAATLDDYFQKHPQVYDSLNYEKLNYWMQLSKKKLGRSIDPREGGVYEIEDTKELFSYDCMSLSELVHGIEAIEELKSENGVLTIAQAEDKLRHLRFPDWRSNYSIEKIFGLVEKRMEKQVSIKERNTFIIQGLLSYKLGMGGNYTIWVVGRSPRCFETFCETLKQDEALMKKYKVAIDVRRGTTYGNEGWGFLLEKPRQSGTGGGTADFSQFDEFSKNQLMIRWQGNALVCADFVKQLARIVVDKGYAAHFDTLMPSNVIGGAFYDPTYKKSKKE